STADWMICCTRMIPVTAAMVSDGPIRSSHSSAARAIGSNGNGRFMSPEATSRIQEYRMIVAFSISPAFPGQQDAGVSEAVARAVRVVRESGLPNSTDAMFTSVEGEWDEVMAVVKRAVDAAGEGASRVGLVLKADIRPGYETGQLADKVQRVEQHLGNG